MTQRMGDGLLDQYVSRRLINRLASTLLVTDVPEATVEAFCDELTRQVLARLDVLKQQEERRAEAVGWIRAMPHPIAACALWQLAERVHCTLWTGYTVEQAYLWLRQAVRGF